jgi:uncharacterized membrane protein YkvA (DUF1232 family)
MELWQLLLAAGGLVLVATVAAVLVWMSRAALTPAQAVAELRALGVDLARLPGRLRRIARDPRTPRRARWLLVGLAIYVASPIDLIPDVIPGIGHLDEVILVPLVLRRIRRMIPPEVWAEHFPSRSRIVDRDGGPGQAE